MEAKTGADSKIVEETDYSELHFNAPDWLKRVLD
jgi:hypothetical protein